MRYAASIALLALLSACSPETKTNSADSVADTTADVSDTRPSGIAFSAIYSGVTDIRPGVISVDSVGSYHILDITNQNFSRHMPAAFTYDAKSFVYAMARMRASDECTAIWYSVKSEDSDQLVVVLYGKDSLPTDYYVAAIGGELSRISKITSSGRIYSALSEKTAKTFDVNTNYADIKDTRFELSDMDTRSYENTENGIADGKEYIADYFEASK